MTTHYLDQEVRIAWLLNDAEAAVWQLGFLAGLVPVDAQEEPIALVVPVLDWALEEVGANDLQKVGELADRVVTEVRQFLRTKGMCVDSERTRERIAWPVTKPLWPELLDSDGQLRFVDDLQADEGLLAIDALLADLLDALSAPKFAAIVRATKPSERGRRWTRTPQSRASPACRAVVKAVLARLTAEHKARHSATPMRILRDGDHVLVPKVASGFAWAIGTTGERVNGDEYAEAPAVARYVSRSLGLTPTRIQQRLLPVAFDEVREELAVCVLRDSQALISPLAGKAALMLAVASRDDGALCRVTVDDFTRALKPDGRIQARDRQAVVAAVRELRSMGVVLPSGVDLLLWDIAAPTSAAVTTEAELFFGWSRSALTEELGAIANKRWRGRFILNLTGAMRMDARHTLELRAYVQIAASWNEAQFGPQSTFQPRQALRGTAEELAARFNALSPAAVQAITERGSRMKYRRDLSDDKRRVVEALERLADEAKLIRLEKVGETYQPMPPDELLHAREEMRSKGRRPEE